MINKILKHLLSPEKYARTIGVNLGKNCFVPDKNTWSSEPYLITIGNNCQITFGTRIFTHGGAQVLRNQIPDFDIFGKVKIGNNVYIGNNSLIMPGVKIEDNVLVAAGSVVTKSIPKEVVVAGNPAKIICTIEEYLRKNNKYNLNTKRKTKKEKKNLLTSIESERLIQKEYLKIQQ